MSLNIPHLELVLREIFLIAPTDEFGEEVPPPATIGELALATNQTPEAVAQRLGEIKALSTGIALAPADFADGRAGESPHTIIDVREEWELEETPIPGAICAIRTPIFTVFEDLKRTPLVLTVSQQGKRAFSAAMLLRARGISQAQYLEGGLEHWFANYSHAPGGS